MKKEQIFKDLQEIIKNLFAEENIELTDTFKDDIGLDSLDCVELEMEVEKLYNIRTEVDVSGKTVDEFIDILLEDYLKVV